MQLYLEDTFRNFIMAKWAVGEVSQSAFSIKNYLWSQQSAIAAKATRIFVQHRTRVYQVCFSIDSKTTFHNDQLIGNTRFSEAACVYQGVSDWSVVWGLGILVINFTVTASKWPGKNHFSRVASDFKPVTNWFVGMYNCSLKQ